jgi:hypothetical protein
MSADRAVHQRLICSRCMATKAADHQQSFRPLRPGPYGPTAGRVGLVNRSAVPARPDPHAPQKPSPQPANPASFSSPLLVVPEAAQPTRLGVAIK